MLYQLKDDFKFMNDTEKRRHYDTWVETLVTQCSDSNVLKGVAIQKMKKGLLDAQWTTAMLDFVLKTDLDSVNAIVINLDDKKVEYCMEESDRDTSIILLKCTSYYYPLIHMYSEPHSRELFMKLKTQFTNND